MKRAGLGRGDIEYTRHSEARVVYQFARATIQTATNSTVSTTEIIFSHFWGLEL